MPAFGLACDLLWSDPKEIPGKEGWSMSVRGISMTFSSSIVKGLCNKLNIDLIVRGHQIFNKVKTLLLYSFLMFICSKFLCNELF